MAKIISLAVVEIEKVETDLNLINTNLVEQIANIQPPPNMHSCARRTVYLCAHIHFLLLRLLHTLLLAAQLPSVLCLIAGVRNVPRRPDPDEEEAEEEEEGDGARRRSRQCHAG